MGKSKDYTYIHIYTHIFIYGQLKPAPHVSTIILRVRMNIGDATSVMAQSPQGPGLLHTCIFYYICLRS